MVVIQRRMVVLLKWMMLTQPSPSLSRMVWKKSCPISVQNSATASIGKSFSWWRRTAFVTGLVKDNQPTRVVRKAGKSDGGPGLTKVLQIAVINVRVLHRELITRSLALLNVI